MPIYDKSTGADLSFQINTPNGILAITPDLVGSYTAVPGSEWKDWMPFTGQYEPAVLAPKWSGTIELIRKNSIVENFWAEFEAAYFNGVSVQPSTMLETIREADGSITQWNYLGTLFRLTRIGEWRGDEFVMQTLEFRSTRRIKI